MGYYKGYYEGTIRVVYYEGSIKANKLEGSPTTCIVGDVTVQFLHDKNNTKLQASCRHVTRDRMYDSEQELLLNHASASRTPQSSSWP